MNKQESFDGNNPIHQATEVLRTQYTQARNTLIQSETQDLTTQTLQEALELQQARQTLAFLFQRDPKQRTQELHPLLHTEQRGDLEKRFTQIQTFALGFIDALKREQLLQGSPQNPTPEKRLEETVRDALFANGAIAREHAEQAGYDQKMIALLQFYANHQIIVPKPEDIVLLNSFTKDYPEPNTWTKLGRELKRNPYIPFIYIYAHDGHLPTRRDFYPAQVFIDTNIASLSGRVLLKSDTIIIGSTVNGGDKKGNRNLGLSAVNFATIADADTEKIHVCATNISLEGTIKDSKFVAEQTTIGEHIQNSNSRIFTRNLTTHNQIPENTIQKINELQEERQRADFEMKFGI